MKKRIPVLVLSSLFLTNTASVAATDLDSVKEMCKQIPTYRKDLAKAEGKKIIFDLQLKHIGLNLNDEMRELDNHMAEMRNQLNQLEMLCEFVGASRFVSSLRGYDTIAFGKHLGSLLQDIANLDETKLQIDEQLQARLLAAAKSLFRSSAGLLESILETDPIKKMVLQFEMEKVLDITVLLFLEILGIDTNDIKDVDTLLIKIEARMAELRVKDL